jgi:SAM-dependent methyltransferase
MFKEIFVEKLLELVSAQPGPVRILELGSGRSEAIAPVLAANPQITYVGIEPDKVAYDYAMSKIGHLPNVKLINTLGYNIEGDSFDICFSLSTLEHVKQLEKFLEESARVVRPGGRVVHFYDLGHSLHPSSLKERVQVFLGNRFPQVLPEDKFVSYVDESRVRTILAAHNVEYVKTTYHQMSSHKTFVKSLPAPDAEAKQLIRDIVEWEYKISPTLQQVPLHKREGMFYSVCVWGQKKN